LAPLHFPRPVYGIAQVAAAVHHSENQYAVGSGLINDAIALKNDFSNVIAIGFRYMPAKTRKIRKCLHARQDALDELSGINLRVLADISVQLFEVITRGI